MTGTLSVPRKTNWLFDSISLVPLPQLRYWADGDVGHRVLFITDAGETFTITFEEGMSCLDQRLAPGYIHAEHRSGGIYLHQCRGGKTDRPDNVCFFRLEFTDRAGVVHIQPGQMVTGLDYKWADGVEPVLLALIASLQESCGDLE